MNSFLIKSDSIQNHRKFLKLCSSEISEEITTLELEMGYAFFITKVAIKLFAHV